MRPVSKSIVQKLDKPNIEPLVPVLKVAYYDTPYSVPSWGMKYIIYNNLRRDNVFHEDEAIFVGRDKTLMHSWGEFGPEIIPDGKNYMCKWLGYFYAQYTGTYKFFLSVDDGGKLYIGDEEYRLTLKPEELTEPTNLLSLVPMTYLDTYEGRESSIPMSWQTRDGMVTFSGYFSAVAGHWYPLRIEYYNESKLVGDQQRYPSGDILVRYEEPSSSPDAGVRKVLSAGVVNYPDENIAWENALDAEFIGSGVDTHYVEFDNVVGYNSDIGLGKVGQFVVKLPVNKNDIIPIKNLRGHYRYKYTDIIIKPGRLIDVWTGYHIGCNNYVDGDTPHCALGIANGPVSGYFSSTLCKTNNPKCPWQAFKNEALIKRNRGRITNLQIKRTEETAYLEIICEDNLHYLNEAINENYPDYTSYALFDYEGKIWGRNNPDGINKPTTYDGFKLNDAIIDSCIKSGIDPTYLYGHRKHLDRDFNWNTGNYLIEGSDIILSRRIRYGMSMNDGSPGDKNVDQEYAWAQDFGDKLIDMIGNLSDLYGYLFYADPDGNIVFSKREAPEFKIATDSDWILPEDWTIVTAPDALGGAYLYGEGTSNNPLTISGSGARFDLYFTLPAGDRPTSWNIMYNEGINTSGYRHGQYDQSEIVYRGPYPYMFAGVHLYADVDTFVTPQGHIVPGCKLPKGAEFIVMMNPKYTFQGERLQVVATKAASYTSSILDPDKIKIELMVEMGILSSVTDESSDYGESEYSRGEPNWGGKLVVASGIDITNEFGPLNPGDPPRIISIPFNKSVFAVTSGLAFQYGIKFTTEIYYNHGQEGWKKWTDAYLMELLDSGQNWRNAFGNVLMLRGLYVDSVYIDSADPEPTGWKSLGWTDQVGAYSDHSEYVYFDDRVPNQTPTHEWQIRNWQNRKNSYLNISFYHVNMTYSGILKVFVKDSNNDIVYGKLFDNSTPLPWGKDFRYSTEGLDLKLGYNPNILSIRSSDLASKINGTNLYSEADDYTIIVSGGTARVEALAIYAKDNYSPKYFYNTVSNIYGLDVNYNTKEIRNDVIVVGNLKGYVVNPKTGDVINPENPTIDYVYSRASDIGSTNKFNMENSIGKKSTFIIYEPNINTQDHADWLALAAINRHRRLLAEISFAGVGVPFLDIDDPITVTDEGDNSVIQNSLHWIEGYSEEINRHNYRIEYIVTPLAPWPSYVPSPPVDLDLFKVNGEAYAIVNVKMDDQYGFVRRSDASGTYDPYESDGGSNIPRDPLWDLGTRNGRPNSLRIRYRQLVDGWIRVGIKRIDGGTGGICTYLIGNADEEGQTTEFRPAGEYELLWDSVDANGKSRRTSYAPDFEDIDSLFEDGKDIFVHDGEYCVVFTFESAIPSDHDKDGYNLKNYYDTVLLPNSLTEDYSTYGEVDGSFNKQTWEIEIGPVGTLAVFASPGFGEHNDKCPDPDPNGTTGIQKKIYIFTSSDNGGEGFKAWLYSTHGPTINRRYKRHAYVEPGMVIVAPKVEYYLQPVYFDITVDGQDVRHYGSVWWYPLEKMPFITPIGGGQARTVQSNIRTANEYTQETYPISYLTQWEETDNDSPDYDQYDVRRRSDNYAGTKGECWEQYFMVFKHGDLPVDIESLNFGTTGWDILSEMSNIVKFHPITGPHRFFFDGVPNILWSPDGGGGMKEMIEDTRPRLDRSNYPLGWPGVNPQDEGWSDSVAFKGYNLLYAARWFTIYFDMFDRSGRRVNCSTSWGDGSSGIGMVPEDLGYPHPGAIAVTGVWVPESDQDITGQFKFGNNLSGPRASWLKDGQETHPSARQIEIPGYSDVGQLERFNVMGNNPMTNHVWACKFNDDPLDHSIYMATDSAANNLSNFRNWYTAHAFYVWPIWAFWEPVAGASNFQYREEELNESTNEYCRGEPQIFDI